MFYSLPAFLAFFNPDPLTIAATATALPLFYFGGLINTSADVQKMTAKTLGRDLISDGIWSHVRHVNYSGDLMRYLSFAIISGSAWAFLVPLAITALYLQRIGEKKSMSDKYSDFASYRQHSTLSLVGMPFPYDMTNITCTYTGDLHCEAIHSGSGATLSTDAPR